MTPRTHPNGELDLVGLASRVAAALPGDWQAYESQSHAREAALLVYLPGEGSLRLQLELQRQPGLLACYGLLEEGLARYAPLHESPPRITVAVRRGPEAIAVDIRRQLLRQFAAYRQRCINNRMDDHARGALVDEMAGLLVAHGQGLLYRHGADFGSDAVLDGKTVEGGTITCHLSTHNGRAYLRLDGLSFEEALVVVAALCDARI